MRKNQSRRPHVESFTQVQAPRAPKGLPAGNSGKGHVSITISYESGPVTYRAAVSMIPGTYGGYRLYLRCPHCHSRRSKLLATPERMACRDCFKTRYKIEGKPRFERALQGATKREARLGRQGQPVYARFERPKGMHRTRYHRNLRELRDYRVREIAELTRLYGDKPVEWSIMADVVGDAELEASQIATVLDEN